MAHDLLSSSRARNLISFSKARNLVSLSRARNLVSLHKVRKLSRVTAACGTRREHEAGPLPIERGTPSSQRQDLALTVSCMPYSFHSDARNDGGAHARKSG
jgi:hypothetical protein